jgi:leucyl aminopeptidase
MKYSAKTGRVEDIRTECLATTFKAAKALAKSIDWATSFKDATRDFDDKTGATLMVNLPARKSIKRLLIVGTDSGSATSHNFRKAMGAVASNLKARPIKDAVLDLEAFSVNDANRYEVVRLATTQLSSQFYWFEQHKSAKSSPTRITRITLLSGGRSKSPVNRAVRHANALHAGLELARNLGNQPPNICNPPYLAKEARKLAEPGRVKVQVLDESQLDKLGMGAFMSVTRGSDVPGKLIVIDYRGAAASEAPYVLVGKGITFDTGGISLKPGPGMDEMKFDMCGAASVFGALKATITAKLPINVVGIVAAAENMPSGKASRPGDIVKTMSGKTVEILNTDAEGRLVLCDALTYAARFKPKSIIDIATLTGACIIALGNHASGLFANNDDLAKELMSAGEAVWDRAWQLPLWDDYQAQLKSPFADMANIGGRNAGSVTAACFLSRFAKDQRWAHLDIAGSAFGSGPNKGSTGRPVPLLFQYLLRHARQLP